MMMCLSPIPCSIFLIVRNEADRLRSTLSAVRDLTDDLVVVDSGSTDESVAIAKEFGVRVFYHEWSGFGPQKRFAEDQCRHDWLFNIDADEVVPAALSAEIRALFMKPDFLLDAYRVPISEVFQGEGKPHRWAYTLYPVRLYNRKVGRYVDSPVHDRVHLSSNAQIDQLKERIHHYSVRSLGDQINKLNSYSDLQALDMEKRGVHIASWRIFVEFPFAFIKAYFFRRHFVRGIYGFMTAVNYAFSRHLRLAKHIERRRMKQKK